MNKNVYLKGRLGGDSVALMAGFKSWFQPSVAVAAAVERSFKTGQTRTGLTVQVRGAAAEDVALPLLVSLEIWALCC